MSRIYVPLPYLPVRKTLFGIMVIYPVDFCDSLLITLAGFLTHLSSASVLGFRFIRSDIECHLTAHCNSSASFTLKAIMRFAFFVSGDLAGSFTDPAEGNLGRSFYLSLHAAPSSFLGSTKKVSSWATMMPHLARLAETASSSRSAKSLSLAISSVARM